MGSKKLSLAAWTGSLSKAGRKNLDRALTAVTRKAEITRLHAMVGNVADSLIIESAFAYIEPTFRNHEGAAAFAARAHSIDGAAVLAGEHSK